MRPPIACILVACDLSSATRELLGFATALASPLQARLVLMHVIDAGRFPALHRLTQLARCHRHETNLATDHSGRWRKKRHLQLVYLVKTLKIEALVVRRVVTVGIPHAEILAMARQVKADVILVGTGNAGRKSGDRLGSTARHILGHSPVPVVTVCLQHLAESREL